MSLRQSYNLVLFVVGGGEDEVLFFFLSEGPLGPALVLGVEVDVLGVEVDDLFFLQLGRHELEQVTATLDQEHSVQGWVV